MKGVNYLEEFVGKSIIVETHNGKLYSGKLVDYMPEDEYIKLSNARVLGDFSRKPCDIKILTRDIKLYERKLEMHGPFYTPRR